MPRYTLLLALLLSAFTRTSVGGLPANCATPAKKMKAMAKKFFDPTKAGEVFCPLRDNPIEHLEASFAHIAGQETARVRLCHGFLVPIYSSCTGCLLSISLCCQAGYC